MGILFDEPNQTIDISIWTYTVIGRNIINISCIRDCEFYYSCMAFNPMRVFIENRKLKD